MTFWQKLRNVFAPSHARPERRHAPDECEFCSHLERYHHHGYCFHAVQGLDGDCGCLHRMYAEQTLSEPSSPLSGERPALLHEGYGDPAVNAAALEWAEACAPLNAEIVLGCCSDCERCRWQPDVDCGLAEHPHCSICGHCNGRHSQAVSEPSSHLSDEQEPTK